jgi:hypothetical protein
VVFIVFPTDKAFKKHLGFHMTRIGNKEVQKEAIDDVALRFFSVFDNRNQAPQLSKLNELCIASAQIVNSTNDSVESMSLAQFIATRQRLLSEGQLKNFVEWEIEESSIVMPSIANRLSRYGKQGVYQKQPFQINGYKSFQFVLRQGSWKISAILWKDVASTSFDFFHPQSST